MMKKLILLCVLIFSLVFTLPVFASQPLPPSAWYAVVWSRDTDTLHWVNADGEQGSITRPKLPNEGPAGAYDMHISPNGRYLALTAGLMNGNQGIGFYDFQAGAFMMAHEAQPGEVIMPSGHQPILRTSNRFALALQTPGTNAWRTIAFDLTTGNAIAQITSTDPTLPGELAVPQGWMPEIVMYGFDEANPSTWVHVRFMPPANDNTVFESAPSFFWYPEGSPQQNNAFAISGDPLPLTQAGFDVSSTTGWVVYAHHNAQFGAPDNNQSSTTVSTGVLTSSEGTTSVFEDGTSNPRTPRWLNGIQWVGFFNNQEPLQPAWNIIPAAGPANARIPLGPNFGDLHGTPDGYLAVDYNIGRIYHVTNFSVEAFTSSFDDVVFQTPEKTDFEVIHITPFLAQFTLASLPGDAVTPGQDLAITPQVAIQPTTVVCQGALAPRLTVGETARVSFSNGQPLNVRTAPNGDLITQFAEGTVMDVVGGPQCDSSILWWQINSNGTQGWVAEGVNGAYFVEPYDPQQVAPPVIPTATPINQVAPPVVPTNTPSLQIAPPVVPTNTPQLQIAPPLQIAPTNTPMQLQINPQVVNCPQSPPTRLKLADIARTIQPDGTLALRTNITDEIPSHQLPKDVYVTISGSSQCRNGIRMWPIATNLNGQVLTGWVAEGFNQVYYLEPTS